MCLLVFKIGSQIDKLYVFVYSQKKGIISLIMIVNLTTLRLVPMTNIFLCDPIAAATGRGMKTLPESLSNF